MSLRSRLERLEASVPPAPLPEPSGEEREGEAIAAYLVGLLLATMPDHAARRVVDELTGDGPRSPLTERVVAMVRHELPEPWTCVLDKCECGSAGNYVPFVLPAAVCAALDKGRATYSGARSPRMSGHRRAGRSQRPGSPVRSAVGARRGCTSVPMAGCAAATVCSATEKGVRA